VSKVVSVSVPFGLDWSSAVSFGFDDGDEGVASVD